MKLERAIKNLTKARKDCGMIPSSEYTQTINLAIEAMEAVKMERNGDVYGPIPALPGEKEE